jgi:hypothetical protein
MALVVQGLVAGPLGLAALYLLLVTLCCRRLAAAHSLSPRLSVRKLFAASCLLSAALRAMSFGSIAAVAWLRYGGGGEDDDDDDDDDLGGPDADPSSASSTQAFYEKALVVLFDFPDFSIVSAYALLLLAWSEAFVEARHHWLNTSNMRKNMLMGYLVFNALLYSAQVALYALLFFPTVNKKILSEFIYLTLAGINLALPLVWLIVLLYLSLVFSGFPMASRVASDRLVSLGRIGMLWTLARLAWGFVALTSVADGWLFKSNESDSLYTIELVSLFVLVEVVPIMMALSRRNIHALGDTDAAAAPTSPSSDSMLAAQDGSRERRSSLDNIISSAEDKHRPTRSSSRLANK